MALPNANVCRGCGEIPERFFGRWIPHVPGECPQETMGLGAYYVQGCRE
jgi:hypothetical protein